MEATLNVEFTREKQQALLIGSYKRAVALLHRNSTQQQGKAILLQILNNPDSHEPSLRELRLSTLLSLAQLNKMQGLIKNALYYWHQSTKIQSNFNTWVKIAQSLQKIREQMLQQISNGYQLNQQIGLYQIQQQIEYSYKNSIKQSPSHWRPQLLSKLKQIYQRHGKDLQVKDLEQMIKDNKIDDIYCDKGKDPQQNSVQLCEMNAQIEENSSLDNVNIPLYYLISEQVNPQDNINTWDYIMSLCNFLMNPVGSKKSSKKYDELLTKFTKFNMFKTQISLIIKNPVQSIPIGEKKQEQKNQNENGIVNNNVMEAQNEQKQINYQFQEEMDIQMRQQQNIKQNEMKRLSEQQNNQQKLYNLILDNYRDLLKQNNSLTQTKSKKSQVQAVSSNNKVIFESLLDYFREVFISKSINLSMFSSLKYIDPFESPILKNIFNDQQTQQNLYGSIISSVIEGVNRISTQKQREKEKQKQNKQGWTLPLVNQQDNAVSTRERRSTLTPNISISTPGRQKLLEESKISDELSLKLKQQFYKWVNKQKQAKYSNIVEFARSLVEKLFQIYQKYSLLQFIEIEQNETSSPFSTGAWIKNTNKLLAQIICKLLEVTQLNFIESKKENIKILAMILLKHLQQQYNNNPNNQKLIPIYNYALQTCHNAIDMKIYKNSQIRNKNPIFQYSWSQIHQILHYLYVCIMMCSLPNSIEEQKIKMYLNKYQYFYQLKLNKQKQQLILRSLNFKSVIIDPPKFKEMVENRIRKSKLKQLSQQEFQESALIASIDKLLKADMKTSQTIQSVKSIMSISSGSILCYLKSFSKLVQILFNNLQSSNGFNTKFIQNALKVMQIPTLIEALHTKLTQDRKGQKQKQKQKVPEKNQPTEQIPTNQVKQKGSTQIPLQNQLANKKMNLNKDTLKLEYKLKISTLYNLIKIYMLNELDSHNSSLCFRIILYLLEQSLNTMDLFHQSQRELKKYYDVELQMEVHQDHDSVHFQNQQSICKIIIFFDSLIKMRQSNDVRKKFYHRILIRNIRYIYHNYNNHQGTPNQIRVQIYKILNDTFHNKSYKPKKIQDCLGYFLMISRQFASQFDKQQVQFEQKMKRVFNECYLIFKEQFNKNYRFCDRFCRAMQYFVYYMRKKIKQKQVIKFFTANQIICNCCQGPFVRNEVNKQKFDKEVLFIVAKYLQNKKNQQKAIITNNTSPNKQQGQPQLNQKTPNTTPTKQQKQPKLIQLEEEIERYYLKYFLLAVNTGKAWYQMLRFQISKVYAYFDSLINSDYVQTAQNQTNPQTVSAFDDNLELYKHKFKYAKMIGSFIVRNFTSQNYAQAKQYALYRINIANTLKIRERKLNKKFSQMEKIPELMTFHINKYMQGIVTIMLRKSEKQDQQFAIGNKYPEVSFLLYIQYKLPFLIYQCQNPQQSKNMEKTLMSTLEQGIQLINQIRVNGKTDMMIDEANQISPKLFQSRYKVKHLQKQLKVEIICCLSQLILDSLQYIQMVVSKMNKRNLKEEMRKRVLKSNQIQQVKDIEQQKKCVEKLELLSKIHAIISQSDSIFEEWRTQNDTNQQKVQLEDNQSSKKIVFKDKYLFPDYLISIQGIQSILKKFLNILERIVKQNISSKFKKQNYYRFIFTSNLWISKIHNRFGSRQITLSYVKEIANLKNEDLINFYHHYQNQPTEQNLVLAEFYSRDIVFHYTKIQAVEHLLNVYSKPDTLEISIMLIRKLAKMYPQKIDREPQKQKKQENKITEQGKQKQREKEKEKDKEKKPKDQKQKVKQGQKDKQKQKEKQKGKKSKKDGKDSKEKINKNTNKIERKIKWIYILFLRGFQIYMDALITHLNQKEQILEQKFEKALLQFKNKIKRQVQKDKKKSSNEFLNGQKRYAARLVADSQMFIAYYQGRFNKKIRMKTAKKKAEQSQIQTLNPQRQKGENKEEKQVVNIKKEIIEEQQSGEEGDEQKYIKANEQDENQAQASQEQIENENAMEQEDKKVMKQQSGEENYNSDRGNIVNQQQQDPEQDDSDP